MILYAPTMKTIAVLVLIAVLAPLTTASVHPGEDESHAHNPPHPAKLDPSRFFTDREGAPLELPIEEDAFLFAVFGDRTGGPADGVEVLAQAVEDVNLIEPDLVMTVGDLIQGYNQTPEWLAQMREYKGIMDGLLCPWFPVAGNHDVYWRGDGRPEGEHEASYETHFGPLWYAFEHKDSFFIVLYSDEGNPETGERSFSKPAAQKMSPEQFAWLEQTLDRAADAEHVFVFLHHPRWLKGGYGDDWDRVHELLASAGNVSAVFAGHIHRMRYDGKRDGIEYITLATVGGGQSEAVPAAGYLHQFHLVMVRERQIALASIPVGEVQDVRAITGEVSDETRRLAGHRPSLDRSLAIQADGSAAGVVNPSLTNPTSRPIELTMMLDSEDPRWRFSPDHQHFELPAGETVSLPFRVYRPAGTMDESLRVPEVVLNMDYLTESARFPIPESRAPLPVALEMAAPAPSARERALSVYGDDCMVVPSEMIEVPDGPFTLECWMRARSYDSRVGLVTKTQGSEYGFFVNRGVPSWSVHLGGSYVEAEPDDLHLQTGRWHHLAGVYDGQEIRLYVNGELVDRVERSGPRRTNSFPLLIGADPNGRGEPMSYFDGLIDGVRLSTGARYTGQSFAPARRPEADDRTILLLNFDEMLGPWAYDESASEAHPMRSGDPEIVPADR